MSKMIDFEEAKKKKETEDAIKAEISQNLYLQYAIKAISNLDMNDESADVVGLLNDYKTDCEKNNIKFQSLGEMNDNLIQFYYQMLQIGYRTFGANYFKMMCMNPANCIQLFRGIWALICGIEDMSDTIETMGKEISAFRQLKLTEEQQELFSALMAQSREDFISNLMTQAEKLEKEQEENHTKNNLMKDEQNDK